MNDNEPMLTTPQVMRELGWDCRDTVYRHIARGTIPAFKLGGEWRFYMSEIRAALRSVPEPVDILEQPARARKRVA